MKGRKREDRGRAMNAADIMTPGVVTVTPDATVPEVVRLLLGRGISGVPVVDAQGHVLGMVSEGDLIRRAELGTEKRRGGWATFFTGTATLAEEYVRAHGETAADIMTQGAITVAPATPVAEIAALMEKHRIKRVPVVAEGRLAGIVSRSNLLRALASATPNAAGPAGTDDAAIRDGLLARLAQEPWARRSENSIVVIDGVVHLWGLVGTREEQRAMELAAGAVPGVRKVESHTVVLAEEPYPLYPAGLLG